MSKSFPHYPQLDAMDCGPTCLRMVAKHYGRSYTLQTLREGDKEKQEKNLWYFFRYLLPYKPQYAQIVVVMVLGSILALIYQSNEGGGTYCPLDNDARVLAFSTPKFAKMVSSTLTD